MFNFAVSAALLCVFADGAVLNFKRILSTSETDTRIVGGVPAAIEEVPYQLSFKSKGDHFCGASIINELHALTAAHCCVAYLPSGLEVASGSASLSSGIRHQVVGLFIHPKYNKFLIDYDACVLRVVVPFVWGPTTQPIAITPIGIQPVDFEPVVVSGWGTIADNGPAPSQLLKVTVNVIPHEICNVDYALIVTPRMICAGKVAGGKDACQGDSGGPLHEIATGHQVGIVSWGFGCAQPQFPGVYTNIADPEVNSFIVAMSGL